MWQVIESRINQVGDSSTRRAVAHTGYPAVLVQSKAVYFRRILTYNFAARRLGQMR
jgi:hypothetical protein